MTSPDSLPLHPASIFTLKEKPVGRPTNPRVAVIHQNRTQAEALSVICTEIFPSAKVAAYSQGEIAFNALLQRPVQMLLIGLTFDDIDGIGLLKKITDAQLAKRILIVSERWDEHVLLALRTMLFAGAIDLTTESLDTVKQVLRHVSQGHGYISPTLRRYLIDELPNGLSTDDLTTMEYRVLSIIGDGSDNKEAALQLGISESTIQTHRRNIMRKLGVTTSPKLVREAIRRGVVRIPLLNLFGQNRSKYKRD